jgi:glycosyltransferase involved in cell wall biosynthesis
MEKYSDIHIEWRSEINGLTNKYSALSRTILKPLISGGAKVKILLDEDYLQAHHKIQDPYWDKVIQESSNVPDAPVRINHCIPNRIHPIKGKTNISFLNWETTKMPEEWVPLLNNTCDHIFVTCNSLEKVIHESDIRVPVSTIGASIDIDKWTPEGPITTLTGVEKTDVKFLYNANFIPRKNFEDIITSFCLAFDGITDVVLILKTFAAANTAQQKKQVTQAISGMAAKVSGVGKRPKISIVTDLMSETQIISFMRGCDVYVSSSRGEGFDCPLAQAMSMEKLIVSNRFLGHGDCLTDDNSINVDYHLIPAIDPSNPLHKANQRWASNDIDSFISAMQLAYTSIKSGTHKHLKDNARIAAQETFSPEVVADNLANKIREINSQAALNEPADTKAFISQLA